MNGIKLLGKILLRVLFVIVGLILIALFIIGINSSGKLPAITDSNGKTFPDGISEKIYRDIGGVQQGMFIRGEDESKPVLLFLHGGPGSPELALSASWEKDSARLEDEFVVCYWDQRGAGMSYHKNIDSETMTVEQVVEDTKEVTLYLRERFEQEKIYLLGHSWGSYLGVKTIEKYPEYYHAFMGVGQVTNQTESEKLAFQYMLDEANRRGDKNAVKELEKIDVNAKDFPQSKYIRGTRTKLMNRYGIGIMHKDFSMTRMIADILAFHGYTMGEKYGYFKGMVFSQDTLFPSVIDDNLFESSNQFEIPVYILQGNYDYQVSQELAKEYCDIINAPDKKFYAFENSAHSPIWEEPEIFMENIREILGRVNQ